MCAGNLEVNVRISGEAVVPIDDSVVASVDGGLHHRVGHIASQRIEKVAGAAAGVASGKYVLTMFFEDVPADGLRRMQHGSMCDSAAERCGQADHRGYFFWSLSGNCPRQNATETVADEMKLTAGIVQGSLDARIEPLLNQDIWTLGVDPYARKVGPVSDPSEPRM